MKKVLILSASTGAGHVRAGEALRHAAAEFAPDAEVVHHDIAGLLSRPMREIIVNAYNRITPHAPNLWGALYNKTNTPSAFQRASFLPKLLHHLDRSPVQRLVDAMRPDAIIATHFLPPLFLKTDIPIATVITDYQVHAFWLAGTPSHFFVSTEEMKDALALHGVSASSVTVSGIPIHPAFHEPKDVAVLQERHGVAEGTKTALILSGGYGLGSADRIVQALLQSKNPLTIIAVAGKNERLKQRISRRETPPHIRLITLGWTDALDEYMRLADIVVGKPGGLTTTECITLGKPFIAVDPIPGHEDANVRYMETRGYGFLVKNEKNLLETIEKTPEEIAPGYARTPPNRTPGAAYIWKKIFENLP